MQSTTTKRQCHRQLHGLGLNEQHPTLAANSLAPIRLAYANERFRFLLEVSADSLRRIVPGFVLRPWVGAQRTHITPVARDQAEVVRVSPLPAGVDGLSADADVHSAL
jgi:hypothetical protein